MHVREQLVRAECPDVGAAGFAVRQHPLRRLVCADVAVERNELQQPLVERLGRTCRRMKQVPQGGARDGHARPGECLRLTVQRNAVHALGGDDMGNEARAVLAFLDGLRDVGRDNALAAPAAEGLLHVHLADEPRGHVLENGGALAVAQRPQVRASAFGAVAQLRRHRVADFHRGQLFARCLARATLCRSSSPDPVVTAARR